MTVDQSHLRKYLATLGVAIVASVISLAGLSLRLQGDLLVKQSELRELTPVGRAIILRRQHFLDVATTVLPWFLIVGCLIGLSLTTYGLVGWAKRQAVADELEDIAREKGKTELRKLTDEERVSRHEQEAESAAAQEEEPSVADVSHDARAGTGMAGSGGPPGARPSESRQRAAYYFQGAMQTELDVGVALEELLGADYRVELGVEFRFGNRRQEVDILARRVDGRRQYVFELKYLRNLGKNFRPILTSAIAHAAAAASLLGEGAVPVVVLVHDGAATEQQILKAQEVAEAAANTFAGRPRVLIVSLEDLQARGAEELRRVLDL